MKKFLPIISLILLMSLLAPSMVAFAAYSYYIPIAVYNNSSEDRSGLPILITINSSQLADLGYIDPDGLNTDVQEGASSREFMVGNTRLGVFLPTLLAYQQRTVNYRLGDTDGQTTFPVIVGVGGNVTASDDSAFELRDNFTIEQKVWVDTDSGSAKNFVSKASALEVGVSPTVSENITITLWGDADWINPTGDSGATWLTRDQAWDDNVNTYSRDEDVGAGAWSGYLTLTHAAFLCGSIRYNVDMNTAGDLIDIDAYYDDDYQHVYEGTYAHHTWETRTLDSPQVVTSFRIRVFNNSAGSMHKEIWEVDFGEVPSITVSATGVASGEHVVNITMPSLKYGGLGFDGTVDNVDCNDVCDVGTGNFTIEAWVKPETQNYGFIICKGAVDSAPGAANAGYTLQVSGTTFYAQVQDADEDVKITSDAPLTAGAWTYLVVTADRGGNLSLYRDAVLQADVKDITTVGSLDNTNDLRFGNYHSGDYRGYTGVIDEVRIYDRVLELAEIQANYNGGDGDKDPLSETGLLGWWHIDDATGATVTDEIDGGHGTITDAVWAEGKIPSQLLLYIDNVIRDGTTWVEVADNDNDWEFLANNSTAYMEYLKVSINGTQKLWYEPNTMVTPANLPDRSGNGNTGTINWGTNPAGVEITIGGLSPAEAYVPAIAEDEEIPDFLPDPPSIEYIPPSLADDSPELQAMPQYEAVHRWAQAEGMRTEVAYVILIWITALTMGVGGFVAVGSVWGFVGGFGFVGILGMGTPVWPLFLPLIILIVVTLGVYVWRR